MSVEFRGLTLTIPKKAPGDLAFSVADNETSVALRSIFGEEQYQQIRERCTRDKLDLVKTVDELDQLLRRCLETWGLAEGE